MRVQVIVPDHLWWPLRALADQEFRTPRKQLQVMMLDVLEKAFGVPAKLREDQNEQVASLIMPDGNGTHMP